MLYMLHSHRLCLFNTLYADKGYISKKLKETLLLRKIKIITPNKKKQIITNTREDQYELKNRMKIEYWSVLLSNRQCCVKEHRLTPIASSRRVY